MMLIAKGQTDVTSYFHLRLTADGTDATGLTVTNFDLQYVRSGATPAAKVDASALGAANSAHADNSAIEVDATDQPGVYRVDWPDAAFATGVDEVLLTVKCATAFTETLRVRLLSVTRGLSGTALPDAAADATGGLPISDAGGLDLDAKLAATNEVTAARMGALTDWINGGRLDLLLDAVLEDTGTTLDGKLNTIDGNVDDILVDTAEIGAAGAGLTNINLPNQTMDIVGNITGNLSGSVGSVTGHTPQTGDGYAILNSGTHGLAALKTLIDALIATVGVAGAGLTATATAVWAVATRLLTAGTNIVLAKGTGITGFNDLSAAQVNAEADTAIADAALATAANLATTDGKVDAIKAETDKLADTLEDDGGTFRFTANALEEAPTGGSAPTAGEIADEVRVELATELGRMDAAVSTRATPAQVATELATYDAPTNAEMVARTLAAADYATAAAVDAIPTNAELATALGTADDAVLAAIAALNNLSQANIRTAIGLGSANLDTQLADLPTNAELATALGTADDAVLAAISALNNISSAQVKAQVVAALSTDTYAEPSSVPAETASLTDKVGFMMALARNRQTLNKDTGLATLRNAANGADIGTRTDSDDGTEYTKGAFS